MITFEKNEKNLTIPSALGNFGNTGGSGGGVTPEEVEGMIESAITEYDAEVQVDLEDIRENVSGNTGSIAELSAFTETLAFSVSEQGQDVEQLSGATETLFGSVSALTGSVDNLAGATTALTQGLETLSGATVAVEQAVAGKQDALSAGNGIEISGATVSVKAGEGLGFSGDTLVVSGETYTLPVATDSVLGGVKIGSGLTIDNSGVLSTSGGPKAIYFNKLSKAEKKDVYDELVAYGAVSAIPIENYAFLNYNSTDNYTGYYELQLARLLGGQFIFSAIIKSRSGNKVLIKDHILYPDGDWAGSVDKVIDLMETLPTASSSTLGGVKVGSGLTIDANGVLSASGGGGSDYVITDALSAITEPYEGLLAYVRSNSSITPYDYFYFPDPNNYPTEGFVGLIRDGHEESEDQGKEVYISGIDFHWGWINDGRWHTENYNGTDFEYRVERNENEPYNTQFWVIFPENSGLYIKVYTGAGEYEVATGTSGFTKWTYSQPSLYQNGKWTQVGGKTYDFGYGEAGNVFATSAETAAFIADVRAYLVRGIYPQVFLNGRTYNFAGDETTYIKFENLSYYNEDHILYFSDVWFDYEGFNTRGIRFDNEEIFRYPDFNMILSRVDSAGTFYGDLNYLTDQEAVKVYLHRYGIYFSNPDNEDEIMSVGPVKWWNRYKVECQDCEEGWRWYFEMAADVLVGNTVYSGVWGWVDNEHIEVLSWTSGTTYESQTYQKYVPSE